MDEAQYIQIEGTVASLIYHNAENGYTVLRLNTAEGVVTAVGCMPGVNPGESLLLKGGWATHQSYGEQFRAEFAERRLEVIRDLRDHALVHVRVLAYRIRSPVVHVVPNEVAASGNLD